MALAAGKIAPGLIDGEIILRPGKVNRGYEPMPRVPRTSQSSLTREGMFPVCLDTTASGGEAVVFESTTRFFRFNHVETRGVRLKAQGERT
jgi:hypothetical protein